MPNKFKNLFKKSVELVNTIKNCTGEIKKDFFEDMKEHYSYITKTYTDIKTKDHKVIEISKEKFGILDETEIKETLENILESLNNRNYTNVEEMSDRDIASDTLGKCMRCGKCIESGDIYEKSMGEGIYHEHCND